MKFDCSSVYYSSCSIHLNVVYILHTTLKAHQHPFQFRVFESQTKKGEDNRKTNHLLRFVWWTVQFDVILIHFFQFNGGTLVCIISLLLYSKVDNLINEDVFITRIKNHSQNPNKKKQTIYFQPKFSKWIIRQSTFDRIFNTFCSMPFNRLYSFSLFSPIIILRMNTIFVQCPENVNRLR